MNQLVNINGRDGVEVHHLSQIDLYRKLMAILSATMWQNQYIITVKLKCEKNAAMSREIMVQASAVKVE